MKEICEFQGRRSGWIVYRIKSFKLKLNQYSPLRGNSYFDLPKRIKDKKAVLNIQNNYDKCFLNCLNIQFQEVLKSPKDY